MIQPDSIRIMQYEGEVQKGKDVWENCTVILDENKVDFVNDTTTISILFSSVVSFKRKGGRLRIEYEDPLKKTKLSSLSEIVLKFHEREQGETEAFCRLMVGFLNENSSASSSSSSSSSKFRITSFPKRNTWTEREELPKTNLVKCEVSETHLEKKEASWRPKLCCYPFYYLFYAVRYFLVSWITPFIFRMNFLPKGKVKYNEIKNRLLESDTTTAEWERRFEECFDPKKRYAVEMALLKLFGFKVFIVQLCILASLLISLALPQVEKNILKVVFEEDGFTEEKWWQGLIFCGVMLFLFLLNIYFDRIGDGLLFSVSTNTEALLMAVILKKRLHFSERHVMETRDHRHTGLAMNVECINAQRVFGMLHIFWEIPVLTFIGTSLVLSNFHESLSVVVSILVLFGLIFPSCFIVTYVCWKNYGTVFRIATTTSLQMKEMLDGIRSIKFNMWESLFLKKIIQLRRLIHRKIISYHSLYLFFGTASVVLPYLFEIFLLSIVFLFEREDFKISNIFPVISYIKVICTPLAVYHLKISLYFRAFYAFKKFNDYLRFKDEKDFEFESSSSQKYAISLNNVHSTWKIMSHDNDTFEEKESSLKRYGSDFKIDLGQKNKPGELASINCDIQRGNLTVVVGGNSSGKSSLLKTIVGDMRKTKGSIFVSGKVGFCPQNAWLFSDSLKNNIILDSQYDEKRFRKVIELCEMQKLVETHPAGANMMVSDRDCANGYKQKISLARALYNADTTIFILDDIFARMSPSTRKSIFEKVILKYLSHRTVVLATNFMQYCKFADRIIVMEDMNIVEEGRFADLLENKKSSFFRLLKGRSNSLVIEGLFDSRSIPYKFPEDFKKPIQRLHEEIVIDGPILQPRQSLDKDYELFSVTGHPIKLASVWFFLTSFSIGKLKNCSTLVFVLLVSLIEIIFECFLHFPVVWLSLWVDHKFPKFGEVLYLEVFVVVGCVLPLLSLLKYVILAVFSWSSGIRLMERVFKRLLSSSIKFFENTPPGEIIQITCGEAMTSDNLIISINSLVLMVFETIVAVILVSIANYLMIILIAVVGVIFFAVQYFYRQVSRQLHRRDLALRTKLLTFFEDTARGYYPIKLYGAREFFCARYCMIIDSLRHLNFVQNNMKLWLKMRISAFSSFMIVIFSVVVLFLSKSSSTNLFLIGISITKGFSVSKTLKKIISAVIDLEKYFISQERLQHYSELPTEEEEMIQEQGNSSVFTGRIHNCNINFDSVTLKFNPNSKPALNRLSLQIDGGEHVALIGRSGSGKTSLIELLFLGIRGRMYWGRVSIGQMNVRNINFNQLREKIIYVDHVPFVFDGTIRENLDPSGVHNEMLLLNALEKVKLRQFVENLEGGLNEKINAEMLSFGQRQLISVARIFLRNTSESILILDDPMSNVDMHTLHEVEEEISKIFHNCTVIRITHRLSVLSHYDKVLVLEEGKVMSFLKVQDFASDELISLGESIAKKIVGWSETDQKIVKSLSLKRIKSDGDLSAITLERDNSFTRSNVRFG